MKKFLLPLLTILFFTGCQKQVSTDKTSEEIAGAVANKQAKFTVCHYDAIIGVSKTIEVTQNALAGHLAHGDLQGSCSAVLSTICDQDWMVKNLDVDHYRNGDPIPQVTDPTAWAALTTGAWCWYENNSANGATYGKLYNWYAVDDPRGLAPVGWHVPSDAEWTTLTSCLGGESIAGIAMKSISGWNNNGNGTNSSGFTALPGGGRFSLSEFLQIGTNGSWWSSSIAADFGSNRAFGRYLYNNFDNIQLTAYEYTTGSSVRCVRD